LLRDPNYCEYFLSWVLSLLHVSFLQAESVAELLLQYILRVKQDALKLHVKFPEYMYFV